MGTKSVKKAFCVDHWILENNGYEYQRCKGSHFMYSNGIYTVAVNKDLNAMVAKRIIKQYHLQVAGV